MAKREKQPALEAVSVSSGDPLLEAPAELNSPPAPAPAGPTFGQRVGRFIRFLTGGFCIANPQAGWWNGYPDPAGDNSANRDAVSACGTQPLSKFVSWLSHSFL